MKVFADCNAFINAEFPFTFLCPSARFNSDMIDATSLTLIDWFMPFTFCKTIITHFFVVVLLLVNTSNFSELLQSIVTTISVYKKTESRKICCLPGIECYQALLAQNSLLTNELKLFVHE